MERSVAWFVQPPNPRGQSLSHALAEEQWQYEAETARGGYFNRHTLFFIPMHYWGVLTGLAARMTIVGGIIQG